jgi:hypothetical protein
MLGRLFGRKSASIAIPESAAGAPPPATRTRSSSLALRASCLSRISGEEHESREARRAALQLSFCDDARFVDKVVGETAGDEKKKSKSFGQDIFKSLFGTEGIRLWKVVKAIITRYFGESRMSGLKNQIKTYCLRVALQKAKGSFRDREWKAVYNASRALLSDLFYACRLRDDANLRRDGTLSYFARVNPAAIVESASIAVLKASRFLAKNHLSRRGDAATLEGLVLPMLTPRFVYALVNCADLAEDRANLASALEPLLERRSYCEGWRCRRAGCFQRAEFGAVCVLCTAREFRDRSRRPVLRRFLDDASLTPHLRAFIARTAPDDGTSGERAPLMTVLNFCVGARRIRETSSKSLQRIRARQLVDKHLAPSGGALLRELVTAPVLETLEDQLLNELTPAALFVALELCEARLERLFGSGGGGGGGGGDDKYAARSFTGSPEHTAFVAQEMRTTRLKRNTPRRALLESTPDRDPTREPTASAAAATKRGGARPPLPPSDGSKVGDAEGDDALAASRQWVVGDRDTRFVIRRVLLAEEEGLDVLLLPPRLDAILGSADAASELESALEEDAPGAGCAVRCLRTIAARTADAASSAFTASSSSADSWQKLLVVELKEMLGLALGAKDGAEDGAEGNPTVGGRNSSSRGSSAMFASAFESMVAAHRHRSGDRGDDALVALMLGQIPAALHTALRHFVEGAWFGSDSYVCAISSGMIILNEVCPDGVSDFDDATKARCEVSREICRRALAAESAGVFSACLARACAVAK